MMMQGTENRRHRVLNVSLSQIAEITNNLASSISCGYGPSFKQTLITAPGGKVLITNKGLQIMEMKKLGNPIESLILDFLAFHVRSTGDDSKGFVILLSQIIRGTKLVAGSNKEIRTNIAQQFDVIASELLPVIFKSMEHHCVTVDLKTNFSELQESFSKILDCSLQTHFLEYEARKLSSLVSHYITSWKSRNDSLHSVLDYLIDHHDDLCQPGMGRSIGASKLIPGLLVSRGFTKEHPKRCDTNKHHPIKFVLLDCPIEAEVGIGDVRMKLSSSDAVEQILYHQRMKTNSFVAQLQSAEITLVLTTHNLSPLEKTQLSQSQIAVIHSIPNSELRFLSETLSIHITGEAQYLSNSHIGMALNIAQIPFGGDVYTQITPLHYPELASFLVSGSTKGVAQQVKLAVLHCLKTIKQTLCEFRILRKRSVDSSVGGSMEMLSLCSSAYKPSYCQTEGGDSGIGPDTDCNLQSELDSPLIRPETWSVPCDDGSTLSPPVATEGDVFEFSGSLSLIPSGGAFEVCLHAAIADFVQRQPPDAPTNTALTLLKESLLALPRLLHTNAYYFDKPRWPTVLDELMRRVREGDTVGVHGVEGRVKRFDTFHAFNSKCQLINNVIVAAKQLLRLDEIGK